jgi:hypothetical protein
MVIREIAKIAATRAGEASLLFLRHFVCVSEGLSSTHPFRPHFIPGSARFRETPGQTRSSERVETRCVMHSETFTYAATVTVGEKPPQIVASRECGHNDTVLPSAIQPNTGPSGRSAVKNASSSAGVISRAVSHLGQNSPSKTSSAVHGQAPGKVDPCKPVSATTSSEASR